MLAEATVTDAASSGATGYLHTFQTNPYYFSVALILAVVVSVVGGNILAKSAKLQDSWWRFALVIGSVLVSALVVTGKWPPKFGVDLKGGTIIVGQVDENAFGNEEEGGQDPSSFDMSDLVRQLKNRIDPSGVKEISIKKLNDDQIEVTIPDVDGPEAERVWKKMATIGFLQFRIVATTLGEGETAQDFATEQANAQDLTTRRSRLVKDSNGKTIARWYDIGRNAMDYAEGSPGDSLPYKYYPTQGSLVRDAATGRLVNRNLLDQAAGRGDVLTRLAESQGINQLQILLLEPEERFRVDGEHISTVSPAREGYDWKVDFIMTTAGTRQMAKLTTAFSPDSGAKYLLAVVLDGAVMSAPTIDGVIEDRGQISGNFTREEVEDLAAILNAGKINVALKKDYISLDSVESSLGRELKNKGIYAIVISLVVVLVFMAVYYYQYSGLISCFVLLLNLLMIGALLMMVGQALTLTGLAGFVLTVGMSVDANVLIFERIREEIDKGTAVRMAIRNGFDRATTTIVDANVTTLITAIVLYVIGQEQVRSFAVVLILGIVCSMFTAIFAARTIFDWLERKRMIKSLGMMKLFSPRKMPVTGYFKPAFAVSMLLIIGGLIAVGARGAGIFDYDMRGGSALRMVFRQPMELPAVNEALDSVDMKDTYGENVEFVASPLSSEDYPDKTYYKIESTLAIPDGEVIPEGYRDLKTVIKDLFGDQLQRLEVESTPIEFTKLDSEAEENTQSSTTTLKRPIYTSLTQDQDEAEGTQESDQNATQEADATETQSEDASAAADDSGEASATDEETETTQLGERFLAKFELNFAIPVAAETVSGQLLAAATELDLPVNEENIVVTSKSESPRSESFEVQMQVGDQQTAQLVVDKMIDTMSAEPFFPSASSVGGQVALNTMTQAIAALAFSLIGIVAYIWFRFQHIWFGLAAVAALVHDVCIVLGAIAISYWLYSTLGFMQIDNFKISLSVVAALLTVVGYSLNDTIVVFDRIREVRGRSVKFTEDMINVSVGQTLGRTILTSLTTFLVVFILFGWGGDSIHAFAFALTVGVVAGTYSSIFIASPILLWLMNVKHIDIAPVVADED